MNEEVKLAFWLSLIMILLLAFGSVGWFYIQQRTERQLTQLEAEVKTAKEVERVEPKAALFLEKDKESFGLGEIFELEVVVDGKGEMIDGVEFVLIYDPEAVEVRGIESADFFSLYPQKTIDPSQGLVRVVAIQGPAENELLGKESAAALTLVGLKIGQSELRFAKEKTHVAAYGGQDLLKEASSLTLNIN